MTEKKKSLSWKIILTCMIAGCLEMYDFTVFGTLAYVISKNYLEMADPKLALIISYAFFAIGFCFRPLGAIIFGYIGDKFGRKQALLISITIMGISSLVFTALPTYQQIGITSCYIILFTRIMQGISIGGEFSGSIIYAVEHTDSKYKGLAGSIVAGGCMSGILLASLMANLTTLSFMPEWGWRLAFLLGFVIALAGFFIRIYLTETPEFLAVKKAKKTKKIPLIEGLKKSWPQFIATILISATTGINLYVVVIYLPNYLKNHAHSVGAIKWLPTLATFLMALMHPLWGYLSDYLGRKRLLAIGSVLLTAFAFPMIAVIEYGNLNYIIGFLIAYSFVAALYMGGMNTFLVEIFPTAERYSLSSLSYSIGMGVLGGSAPVIAAALNKYSDNVWHLGTYLFVASTLGLFGVGLVHWRQKTYTAKASIKENKDSILVAE